MIQALIEYFKVRQPLSEKEEAFIQSLLPVRNVPKGEYLLKEGDVSKAFWFNLSGIVRMYYTREGQARTTYFYEENTFISAYKSFTRQTPAQMNFQVLEDTLLAEIRVDMVPIILKFSSTFEALARIAMEEEMVVNQEIIASLLTKTPEERYAKLLAEKPALFQRISQHYIASYIGVAPESLSRLKKRVHNRKS